LGLQVVRRPRSKCGQKAETDDPEGTPTGSSSPAPGAKPTIRSNASEDNVDDDEKELDCIPQLVLGVSRVHIDSVKVGVSISLCCEGGTNSIVTNKD